MRSVALLPMVFAAASALPATAPFALLKSSPHVDLAHAPGSWCDGLGGGVFDLAYNFTLAAYNKTGENTNSTGAPLVIASAGATTGAAFGVLSTWASYPYNDFPLLSLLEGALIPHGAVNASGTNVTAGEPIYFIETNLSIPVPSQIYCGIANTDPAGGGTGLPLLAVHNDPSNFFVCPSNATLPQANVVYKPSNESTEYIFDDCYPVEIQIDGLF